MLLVASVGGGEEMNKAAAQCFLSPHETLRTTPPHLGPPANPGRL